MKKSPADAGDRIAYRLSLSGSSHRAGASASAAFDALFRIDFELSVAFSDGFNGALSSAGAASDAIVRNFVCHGNYLQFSIKVCEPQSEYNTEFANLQ